jgi:hypothetical protein
LTKILSAEWIASQVPDAFTWDEAPHKTHQLIRERDDAQACGGLGLSVLENS